MEIRRISGGNKDFVYDEEARKRIEGVHTEPTKKFVEKYNEWRERKINFKKTRVINFIIWFLLWAIIYAVLIWISNLLINKLFADFSFYQNKIYYYVFMGTCLALFSRVIWTALHKKHFYVGWEIIFWIISFGFLLWFFEILIETIVKTPYFGFMKVYIRQLIFIGLGYSLLIKFLRRIKIYNDKIFRNLIIICVLIMSILYLFSNFSNIDITDSNEFFNSSLLTNPIDNSDNSSLFNKIDSFISIPEIDGTWVYNFISEVNKERVGKGLPPLQESDSLNTIAKSRFNKMMENPLISHYGVEAYNFGEVVFYPEGSTEQEYIKSLQDDAPIHWDALLDPIFSSYGYYIGEGPTIAIIGSCPVTEIVGANVDVESFFKQYGCAIETQNSIWLVIDMN